MTSNNSFIISHERDWTSHHVIDWLKYFKSNFIFQTTIDYENNNITIHLDENNKNTFLKLGDKIIDQNTNIWLRKSPKYIVSAFFSNINNDLVSSFIKEEKEAFFRFYCSAMRNYFTHLGSNSQYNTPMQVSKLECLIQAKIIGLKIPRTLISTSRSEIENFLVENKCVIIKPLSEPAMFSGSKNLFTMHTKIFDSSILQDLPQYLFPIYLQKYITKKLEIRVFILNKTFYCAAIFSQNDKQTEIDYRKYNQDRPNRLVPFRLPIKISNKLTKLMFKLGLNTASIDLIYTPHDEYYFLEVNPVGQFGGISHSCNFHIEEIVAKHLAYG